MLFLLAIELKASNCSCQLTLNFYLVSFTILEWQESMIWASSCFESVYHLSVQHSVSIPVAISFPLQHLRTILVWAIVCSPSLPKSYLIAWFHQYNRCPLLTWLAILGSSLWSSLVVRTFVVCRWCSTLLICRAIDRTWPRFELSLNLKVLILTIDL